VRFHGARASREEEKKRTDTLWKREAKLAPVEMHLKRQKTRRHGGPKKLGRLLLDQRKISSTGIVSKGRGGV